MGEYIKREYFTIVNHAGFLLNLLYMVGNDLISFFWGRNSMKFGHHLLLLSITKIKLH